MSEVGNPEKTPTISRREFLKKGGLSLIAVGLLGTACMAEEDYEKMTEYVESFDKTPTPTPEKIYQEATSGLKQLYDQENMPNLETIVEAADQFMAYPPQSEQREKIELNLVNQLTENSTASDVLVSLQTLTNINAREKALNLVWQKRQAGEMIKFGFQPLSEEKINWANENGISPFTLAVAEDCLIPSLLLFEANVDQLLEATPEEEKQQILENNQLPHRIPNPGYIAKLLMTETSGWKNIGTERAITQINTDPEYFPTAIRDLKAIASMFSQIFPYKDHFDNLPGSLRGQDSLSGGAIGPQLMPNNALIYINWYNQANRKLDRKYPYPNPFDIYTGTILAYLFVASEVYARHPEISQYGTGLKTYQEITRSGYERRNIEQIKKATAKWNPHQKQIETIFTAGQNYENTF